MADGKDQVRESRSLYEEQDEWGNSIADLRANLKLTMAERLRRAEAGEKKLVELKRGLKRKS